MTDPAARRRRTRATRAAKRQARRAAIKARLIFKASEQVRRG